MVELADIQPNDIICDPACGTAGFLILCNSILERKTFWDVLWCKIIRPF